MRYRDMELDFICRTLELLNQYDEKLSSIKEYSRYEVTLLMNCLLGLLVFPYENKRQEANERYEQEQKRINSKSQQLTQEERDWLEELKRKVRFPELFEGSDRLISELGEEWGLDQLLIYRCEIRGKPLEEQERSLRKIVALMRHSVAHSKINTLGSENDILQVEFSRDRIFEYDAKGINAFNFTNEHGPTGTIFKASFHVAGLRKFAPMLARSVVEEKLTARGFDGCSQWLESQSPEDG